MRIGVDFDNTIASYDDVFVEVARARGFVAPSFNGTKKQIRDAVRQLDDGEIKWQILQAEVYGPRMNEAIPFAGVMDFFAAAQRRGIDLVVVSHKTQFANYAEQKVDLREAALQWLHVWGFFDHATFGLARDRVFFADTRDEKVARIAALECDVFIDDLEEVFAHPGFPDRVRRVHFTSGNAQRDHDTISPYATWSEIGQYILGPASGVAAEDVVDIALIASQLAGISVQSIDPTRAGGNNRLFKISSNDGKRFALKSYPRQASDPRDRLATEFGALQFMRRHGVTQVPMPIACDAASGFALYEWIDGQSPSNNVAAVDAAVAFTGDLRALSECDAAAAMPEASEACFSPAMIVAQVDRRFSALRMVADPHPDLHAFLEGAFASTAARTVERAKVICQRNLVNFEASIDRHGRCLSPSDFGFHNALARSDGRIVFLDFEYFGWDDPVKLTSDFMLHPGMNLPTDLTTYFCEGMNRLFSDQLDFSTRLRVCLPLYALRWTMILLNEFLPDRWARRVFAGSTVERSNVLSRQLDRARTMLERADNSESII